MRNPYEKVDANIRESSGHPDTSQAISLVSALSENLSLELHQLEDGFVALGRWFSELIQLAKNLGSVSEKQFSQLRTALGNEFRDNLEQLNSTIGKCQSQIDYGLTSLTTISQSMTSVGKECYRTVDELEGLRISVVGLKIESAFSQECLTVLAGFPEQVSDVVLRISAALHGISDNAERVDTGVKQECEHLVIVAQSLQELSLTETESEHKLVELIRGLESKVSQCHALGKDVGKDISQLASRGVFNLQIGDIINQRCSHVQAALRKVGETLEDPATRSEDLLAVRESLCIQVRQIEKLREDVVNASKEMEEIYTNLEFVMDTMEEHHSEGGSIGDIFGSVTGELEHMTDRVRLSLEAAKEIDDKASSLGAQIQTMSGYRRELRSINEKLRLVAMNTTIRATRLGKHGVVIKALSDEICDFQKSTEKVIVWLDKELRSTEKEASQLAQSTSLVQSEADAARAPLIDWIQDLKSLCQALNASHNDFTAKATSIRQYLHSGKDRLQNLYRLDEVFSELSGRLKAAAESVEAVVDPGDFPSEVNRHSHMESMASHYTMHSERAVMQDFVNSEIRRGPDQDTAIASGSGSSGAEPNPANRVTTIDADHDDNIELF